MANVKVSKEKKRKNRTFTIREDVYLEFRKVCNLQMISMSGVLESMMEIYTIEETPETEKVVND